MDTPQSQDLTARHELGTTLEIARIILEFAANLDHLTREICREIVERHRYDSLALYLSRQDGHGLSLAHGARLGPNLPERDAHALAAKSAHRAQSLTTRSGSAWRVAIPIEDGSTTLGVMIAASHGPDTDATRALALCKSLARLIALGIQNAELRILELELAARQERGRISREIHDGVG